MNYNFKTINPLRMRHIYDTLRLKKHKLNNGDLSCQYQCVVGHEGSIGVLMNLHSQTSCTPNFDDYPFGLQTCSLKLGSFGSQHYRVRYDLPAKAVFFPAPFSEWQCRLLRLLGEGNKFNIYQLSLLLKQNKKKDISTKRHMPSDLCIPR